MAEQLLPYLLRVVERDADRPLLAAWAQENLGLVLDGLAASKELVPGAEIRCLLMIYHISNFQPVVIQLSKDLSTTSSDL